VPDLHVHHAALFPDGRSVILVGGRPLPEDEPDFTKADPSAAVVDLRTRAVRRFANSHPAWIHRVAVTADGTQVLTGSGGRNGELEHCVRVWDVKAGKPLPSISFDGLELSGGLGIEFARPGRGRQVAVVLKGRVGLFDLDRPGTRIDLNDKLDENEVVSNPAFSPDGRLLACETGSAGLMVWDLASRKAVYSGSLVPEGAQRCQWSLDGLYFTPDGKGLVAQRSWVSIRWRDEDPEPKAPAEPTTVFHVELKSKRQTPLTTGLPARSHSPALHPGGDWLVTTGWADDDGPELRVYHVPTRKLAARVRADQKEVGAPCWLGFTPDGKKLVGVGSSGEVICWDFEPGKP
jgi:WD40 repeat protein